MTHLLNRTAGQFDVKWALRHHLAILHRFFRSLHRRLITALLWPRRYRRLKSFAARSSGPVAALAGTDVPAHPDPGSELVALKICLLGDCHVGKTTFMERYVGVVEDQRKGLEIDGLSFMEKNLSVGDGATWISFNIWDVAGEHGFVHHVPIACKDAGAILFMFDLTRRQTLNNVAYWYRQAMKWNQSAIPIIIGTKFDDFAQLPLDMQWTVVKEARSYAQAIGAPLFFSSSTHGINVNKIFKFIAATIFNLPWAPERNLTVGEPIIDF